MKRKIFFTILVIFLYQVTLFIYVSTWLNDKLPPGDFAGSVTVVNEMKQAIVNGNFSNWSTTRFCGAPNTLFFTFLDWAAYLPFAFFFNPILAVKVGAIFYLGLAGASMFFVSLYFTKAKVISLWAGMAYSLSPIYTFSTAYAGHMNFPPFYAILPICFLSLWILSHNPSIKSMGLAAISVMFTVWIDTERAFTSLPFIYLFALALGRSDPSKLLFKHQIQDYIKRSLWLIGSALMAFAFASFFLLPAIVEQKHIALFSESVLEQSRSTFGLNNPLYLIDRNGWIVNKLSAYLQNRDCFDAGNFYIGNSLLLMVATVFFVKKRKNIKIGFVWMSLFVCICMIWISSGTTSIYNNLSTQAIRLYKHLSYSENHPFLLGTTCITLGIIVCIVIWLRKKLCCEKFSLLQIVLTSGFLLLAFYTCLFPLLAWLPLYSHMRNPGFFISVLPSFLLTLSVAVLLKHFTCNFSKAKLFIIMIGVTAITIIDYYPYRSLFSKKTPDLLVEDYKTTAEYMKASDLPGRYFSRESYNPLSDMLTVYSNRPTAWYWLNWSCPKQTHRAFMGNIYPKLHHPETIENALALAGLFNVRFVTYNLLEGPLPPKTKSLEPVYAGQTCALFRNNLCRSRLQLYELKNKDDIPSKLEELIKYTEDINNITHEIEPDEIIAKVTIVAENKGLLVFSQSTYPGWSVVIDGKPAKLITIEETLPAVVLNPGKHTVSLYYNRPWYFYMSWLITIITLGVFITFLLKQNLWPKEKPY